MQIRRATAAEMRACLEIRRTVFVEEQRVPLEEEVDGLDDACVHLIAVGDDAPVGTARLRTTAEGKLKIERVAVLREWRGRGIGDRLMDLAEATAASMGHHEVVLAAQIDVVPFYARRGYLTEGDEFVEAGIRHRMMRRGLETS